MVAINHRIMLNRFIHIIVVFTITALCQSPKIASAQNDEKLDDRDYAKRTVERYSFSAPRSFPLSDREKEIHKHIKAHSKLYVEAIIQKFGLSLSDSLFKYPNTAFRYRRVSSILRIARSEESIQLMEFVYRESAKRHDSLTIAISEAVIAAKGVDNLESHLIHLENLMEISLLGLKAVKSSSVLIDAMIRYDNVGYTQQYIFYEYIRSHRETQVEAKEWLESRRLTRNAN